VLIPVRSDGSTSSTHEWSPAVVEDLLDAARSADEEVLLVCDAPASRRIANAVRALTDGPVAVLLLERPVTRWAVYAAALATLPAADLASAPAVVRALDDVVRTRVHLSGVGALAEPSPGIGLHLLSWWPTTRFLVDLDAGEVRRTRDVPVVGSSLVAVARSEKAVLPDAERNLPEDLTEVTGGVWRARRWLEVTEAPDDLAVLAADAVSAARTQPCVVCERPVTDDACLFCAVVCREPAAADRLAPSPELEGAHL
jgi:hypothetical protein